ncbi:MAG: tetratricopeptide repeat protein [Thermodesulfovibrionales bacterium]|nr:tetratricopeptide repeat protein [Thermodesulfovibrionales bacterium]
MMVDQKFSLALQSYQKGNLGQSEALLKEVIRKRPDDFRALNFLGIIHFTLRNYMPALEYFRKALEFSPASADIHFNTGNALKEMGRFDDAILHYQKALQLNPEHFEAYHNLGNVFQRKNQINEAIAYYQEALKRNPNLADAYYNLGTISHDRKYFNEAILFYQKALQLNPNLDDACYMLGSLYADKEQLDEAIAYYLRSLQINPTLAKAHNGLGIVLQKKNEMNGAIEHYRQALTLMPDFIEATVNIGNALRDYGRSEEAESWYRRALSIASDCTFCYDNLFFLMLYHDRYDSMTVFSEHLHFAKQCAEPLSCDIIPHSSVKNPDRILKIGYVSPDFRKHSVSYFIEPVLAAHNKENFQIFCYSDVSRADDVTERLRQYAGQWHSIAGMSDQQVADLIRNDGIDILVDLAGHTANNRLLVFARKPAPVQVNWIGYPATTGLSSMDYKIVDSYTDPPGLTGHLYTEKLIRMPESFLCYLPEKESPEVSPLPALSAGHLTFGSFNNFSKVTHKGIELWAEILDSVPNSKLIMKANSLGDKSTSNKVMDIFSQNGIEENRIELHSGILSSRLHLDFYNRVDIGLDTFPYNGTTTTCEALWMGVPVITLAGKTHAARVGASLLSNVGLAEFVAKTHEEYAAIAVNLSKDLEKLVYLRNTLRKTMASSVLTNANRFANNLETMYRDIWRRWCETSVGSDIRSGNK